MQRIESLYQTRRAALRHGPQYGPAAGKHYLFIDHLWHAIKAGVFAGEPDGKWLWPPRSLRELVDAMETKRDGKHVPVAIALKHAVLLYALFDVTSFGVAEASRSVAAAQFASGMRLPSSVVARTHAFWRLDQSIGLDNAPKDIEHAASALASVGLAQSVEDAGGNALGLLAVARLLALKAPALALNVLQRLEQPNTPNEIDVFVATYLANGLLHDALLLCRSMVAQHSTDPMLRLYARCDREHKLGKLLLLPLDTLEETTLFGFVGTVASAASAARDVRDKLVVYLLLRNRVLEARALWARVREPIAVLRPKDAAQVDEMLALAEHSNPSILARGDAKASQASLMLMRPLVGYDSDASSTEAMKLDE